eukprot:1179463-Prorocentrum_minimum.AAC.1
MGGTYFANEMRFPPYSQLAAPDARSLTILVLVVHGRARGQQRPHVLDVSCFRGFQQLRAACLLGCHPLSTIRDHELCKSPITKASNYTMYSAQTEAGWFQSSFLPTVVAHSYMFILECTALACKVMSRVSKLNDTDTQTDNCPDPGSDIYPGNILLDDARPPPTDPLRPWGKTLTFKF